MKKILIRIESYEKSGLGGMETRIKDFISKKNINYNFVILSNRKLDSLFNKKCIFQNYNSIKGIFKDIITFRDYSIIESNGHRDNLISIINYLLFLPFYKIKNIKLFIVVHGIIGLKGNKGIQKIIYNFIFFIGIIISNKIIVVSQETKLFIKDKFILFNKSLNKKIIIVPNYIKITKKYHKNSIEKIGKALLVSRIEKTKLNGIIESIKFCNKYKIKLDIYGGGEEKSKLEKQYSNIYFYGEVKNTDIKYDEYDIILGMGRSILEGLSKNLVGVLIGYNEIICDVNIKNIDKIKISNFSGRGIKKIKNNLIYNNIKNIIKNN
ncbi:MAG: hypothetical protein Q9M94_07465, partial [Candidatus Gracilibacteria bacterium]|nr:hypothetical protein [Candidatus Gracilibacteria bacterium]